MLFTFIQKLFSPGDSNVIYLNPNGTILTFSEKLAEKKGLSIEEAKGKHFCYLYGDSRKENAFFEYLLELASKKGTISHPVTMLDSKGRYFQIKVSIHTVKDEKNKIIGYTLTDRLI
jgi:PAS domain S-box-containing protein